MRFWNVFRCWKIAAETELIAPTRTLHGLQQLLHFTPKVLRKGGSELCANNSKLRTHPIIASLSSDEQLASDLLTGAICFKKECKENSYKL